MENHNKKNTKEVVENPANEPGFLPVFLANKNINCIIVGGMGLRAKQLFDHYNIQSIAGASGIVDEVVHEYLAGNLVGEDNYCDH